MLRPGAFVTLVLALPLAPAAAAAPRRAVARLAVDSLAIAADNPGVGTMDTAPLLLPWRSRPAASRARTHTEVNSCP